LSRQELNIEINLKCPQCGSDRIDVVYAKSLELSQDEFRVQGLSGDSDRISEIIDNGGRDIDFFVDGVCLTCNALLILQLVSLQVSSKGNFHIVSTETKLGRKPSRLTRSEIPTTSYTLELARSGLPIALNFMTERIPFHKIKSLPNMEKQSASNSGTLFAGWPFGEYLVETLVGQFEMDVMLERDFLAGPLGEVFQRKSNDGNLATLSVFISSADDRFREFLRTVSARESIERDRRLSVLLEKKDTLPTEEEMTIDSAFPMPQAVLPAELIMTAAYRNLFNTETLIRNQLWFILKDNNKGKGPKWWKAVLPEEIRESLLGRAKRRGDSAFTKSEPQHYLNFGECRLLLEKKWDSDFSVHFQRRAQLLRQLQEFEDIRNDIAHFRTFSLSEYDTMCAMCEKLEDAFR